MTTQEVEKRLLEILPELQKLLTKKEAVEKAYYQKYYDILLRSGMANQVKQEAEAKSLIMVDPIFEQYHELELEIKLLYIERDILIEIGRNKRGERAYESGNNQNT